MKDAGWGLMILGGLAILGGFFVDVSRSVGYPIGEVANLHAMHVQALVFQGGFFAFLSGAVLYAGGVINESIRRGPDPEGAETAPEPVAPTASGQTGNADDMEPKPKESPWTLILVGSALIMILMLAAIVAGSSRSPVPTADNAIDMNAMMDMNAPYPALEMPAELNAPIPDVNAVAPR